MKVSQNIQFQQSLSLNVIFSVRKSFPCSYFIKFSKSNLNDSYIDRAFLYVIACDALTYEKIIFNENRREKFYESKACFF